MMCCRRRRISFRLHLTAGARSSTCGGTKPVDEKLSIPVEENSSTGIDNFSDELSIGSMDLSLRNATSRPAAGTPQADNQPPRRSLSAAPGTHPGPAAADRGPVSMSTLTGQGPDALAMPRTDADLPDWRALEQASEAREGRSRRPGWRTRPPDGSASCSRPG